MCIHTQKERERERERGGQAWGEEMAVRIGLTLEYK